MYGKKAWNSGTRKPLICSLCGGEKGDKRSKFCLKCKVAWNKGTKGLVKSNKGSFRKGMEGTFKGRKHTIESGKKMSFSRLGNKNHLGKKHTLSSKEKMSKAHKGIKLSLETRKNMSEARKGEKHHNWKGGITPLNQKIRHTFEYKLWRTAVFERDNYTCIWCGAKSGNGKAVVLNADHIKQFAYYPELRLAIDNGRTLCKSCHETTDTYKKKI